MNIQPPDYDRIEQELWEKYKNEVRDLLERQDPDLLEKIQTFADRFGFEETKVCEKIKNDFMFACWFAKNPTRTKFHEKAAGEYLQQFPKLIRSFKSLPSTGNNTKYIDQTGDIITGKKPRGIKSLDFMWTAGNTGIKCFAAHKFTRERGGAQDHQRNELMRLLEYFENCQDRGTAFFAICDGPYYDKQTLSMLRENARREPPYSFACPVEEVHKNVEKLIKGQVE